jgi:transglutaminase-like putative cysteine protease
MMDYRFSRVFRIICSGVLFFFLWTFELSGIAYAIKNDQQPTAKSSSKSKPEKRSGKNIEDIDDILKSTADTETKRNKVKAKNAEIEADDVEIRKTFSSTERTLKEKGLPLEILERHRKFVKKYDDNYRELQTNLSAIDKAKTKAEADSEIEKAKAHLAKVKPPKKHKPLDPNNLPFRAPEEPVFKEPRTKPEQLQKEQKSLIAGKGSKPLLIASSGSLKGLLSENTQYKTGAADLLPKGSFQITMKIQPTQNDLSETAESQFTPAIRAKALELKGHPLKIYEWVRNNIEYVPTYGSIQGADMCLQTKQCNDIDTASLLIALLRVSGVPAKYVYGTIERKIEDTMNWVGGFTDPMAALNFIASAGIPVKGITEGGAIKYVQMEHVWVETWIKYIPSRGEIHKPGQGDMWIPIDASYKQFKYTSGIDVKSAVPFDAQTFVDQIKSSATINETAGYVTNVNSLLVQQTMQDYQTRVQNYISQNYPNATVGDVLGKKEIIKQEFPYLLGTLNKRVIAELARYSVLPDNLRHKVSFSVTSDNIYYDAQPLNITKFLPEIAGKKITLSYAPATASDEAVINSYLPRPHSDGTPIQPSELPSSLPAYLIQLKPELRIDGAVVATGGAIGMGQIEDFNITIIPPRLSAQVVNNKVTAGEYNAVALAVARISNDQITALNTRLDQTKAKLEEQNFTGLTKDDILGDMLYATVLSYFAGLDAMDSVASSPLGLAVTRLSSSGRFFMGVTVDWVFGVPLQVSAGGLSMDIGLIRSLLGSFAGDNSKKKQFMMASGMNSSALEHELPEQLFSTPSNPAQGLSAVKALSIANNQGIPIYTINRSNINAVLPQLQIDSDAKGDITNAVNAGKIVSVSKTNITFNGWTGCGYMIVDPTTGAGAFMISGGINGAWIMTELSNLLMVSLAGLTSPAMADCLKDCAPELVKYVLDIYTNCLKFVGISCVAIGIVVPSIIVLFEPYLVPALLPAIALVTASCMYTGVGLCNTRAAVSLLAGMLGCISGCGGF